MTHPIISVTDAAQQMAVCHLWTQLYADCGAEQLYDELQIMLGEGWELLGMFDGERCLQAMLFKTGHRFYSGRYLRIESWCIDEALRGQGIGPAMLAHVEAIGRERGCQRMIFDSYVENIDGHRFFYRQGCHIRGFHFNKPL